jgi:hypothetical protein
VDAFVAGLIAHGFFRCVDLLCLLGQSVHHSVDGLTLAPHVLFTVGHKVWVLSNFVQSGTVPISNPTVTSLLDLGRSRTDTQLLACHLAKFPWIHTILLNLAKLLPDFTKIYSENMWQYLGMTIWTTLIRI